MEFRTLGPVEAWENGRRIGLPGSKITTVLGALLLARGRVVRHARLSALLWGGSPPATMDAQIYTYVSRLRKALGSAVRIVREHTGYVLDIGDSVLDLVEFERLADEGRAALEAGRYGAASRSLSAALALWRGPALANVTDFLAEAEQPWLEEAFALATEQRIAAELALGMHAVLVPELTGLVARYPLREQFRVHLISALHRSGRRADALLAFHTARRVLADQLGVSPGRPLTAVYQLVLHSDAEPASRAAMESVRGRARRPSPPPGIAGSRAAG